MPIALTLIAVLICAGMAFGWYLIWKQISQNQSDSSRTTKSLEDQVLRLERTLFETTQQLHGHQKEISSHLLNQQSHSTKIFGEVQSSLGKVQQLTQQFTHIGSELSSLQKLFEIPKRRGIFGEELLKKLLFDILPTERFAMQHRIGADSVVDAAILFSEKTVLCIDAKFPMPSYQQYLEAPEETKEGLLKQLVRDIKKHIAAISSKYVRPDLGTLPFALMYIPAESIYYDLFVTQIDSGLDQPTKGYAFARKVYPVSPNTLFMFLHQICSTFKQEISEQQVWQVMTRVSALASHLQKIQEHNDGIKRYLDYAQKRVSDLDHAIGKFKKDLDQIESYRTQPELTSASPPPAPTPEGEPVIDI